MSGVRDLFFDEFYAELQRVAGELERKEQMDEVPLLASDVEREWIHYTPQPENRAETLVGVDGGVQESSFAYGDFVTVGRAIALIHSPGRESLLEKRVKLWVGQIYDDRDRSFIPGYVRTIAEYDAAYAAAKRVLEQGGRPIVLLDGSLYIGRFPYAVREYRHHPQLLGELFESLSRLRALARDHGFPLVAVSKDSSVFYLYMELLRQRLRSEGVGRLVDLLGDSSSPLDVRMRSERWEDKDRERISEYLEARPLCDANLVDLVIKNEGYTRPLLLAPSIYYSGDEDTPSLFRLIDRNLDKPTAERLKAGLRGFFGAPGVATTLWKPSRSSHPFRVDILASSLGNPEPWDQQKHNELSRSYPRQEIENVLNHLGYWFCNDVEYNVPLRHADKLARFDRDLYRRKYEPFIVRRLEEAGLDVTGTRRSLRETS